MSKIEAGSSQVDLGHEGESDRGREISSAERRLSQLRKRQMEIDEILNSPDISNMEDGSYLELELERTRINEEMKAINLKIDDPEKLSMLIITLRQLRNARNYRMHHGGLDLETGARLSEKSAETIHLIEILQKYGQ